MVDVAPHFYISNTIQMTAKRRATVRPVSSAELHTSDPDGAAVTDYAWMETLPQPLRDIVQAVITAHTNNGATLPSEKQFKCAHRLLLKRDDIGDFVSTVFTSVWDRARLANNDTAVVEAPPTRPLMEVFELINMFAQSKDQVVTHAKLHLYILQLWGRDRTVAPKAPICALVKDINDTQCSDVCVLKVFPAQARGQANYNLLAKLTPGAHITVQNFQIVANKPEYMKSSFEVVQHPFEINATAAFVLEDLTEVPLPTIPLAALPRMRRFTPVLAGLVVTITRDAISSADGPDTKLLNDGSRIPVVTFAAEDDEGSTTMVVLWGNEVTWNAMMLSTAEEISLSIYMPSSIKTIGSLQAITIGKDTILRLLQE